MASEKIQLIDPINDILIETYVSAADAKRARTDMNFAATLFEQSQKSNKELTEKEVDISSRHTERVVDIVDVELDENQQENDGSICRWNPQCVLLLLETYLSMQVELNSGKTPQKKVWEEIAKLLCTKGYNVTGVQCSSKLRSLKKTYKSNKKHNEKYSNDKRHWQFYEIMDGIFSKKALCKPVSVAVAASTANVTEVENQEIVEESDSGSSSSESHKTTITSLLRKRLRQKDAHEKNKMKRHKERMEMDSKMLEVLEKLVSK